MFFASLMKRVPYIGNVVQAKYLVVSGLGKHMNRIMPCGSVRVSIDRDIRGLILSQSDLTEAHFRYIKYFSSLTQDNNALPLGYMIQRDFLTKRKGKNSLVKLLLVHLCIDGNPRTGYLFAPNDFVRIIEKSMKLLGTIKKPTTWQRFLIWLNARLGYINKE